MRLAPFLLGLLLQLSGLSFTAEAFFGLTSRRADFADMAMDRSFLQKPVSDGSDEAAHLSITDRHICRYLQLNRRQRFLCRTRKGYPAALKTAFRLSVQSCEDNFRNDKWNCSLGLARQRVLKHAYREAAYLYAVTAASMVHTFAKSCSRGRLNVCTCEEWTRKLAERLRTRRWEYAGCSDNISAGKRLVKDFAGIPMSRRHRDFIGNIPRHNMNVGLAIVERNVRRRCQCHGVSGSCSTRTCFKVIRPFAEISAALRKQYAMLTDRQNPPEYSSVVLTPLPTPVRTPDSLWYHQNHSLEICSSDLRFLISGRECLPTNHFATHALPPADKPECQSVCCGGNFTVSYVTAVSHCNCVVRSFRVKCAACEQVTFRYVCV